MTARTSSPSGASGSLVAGRDGQCESCRQAPAQLLLHLGGAAPFAVCGGCALTTGATPTAPADDAPAADASPAVPSQRGALAAGSVAAPRFRDESVPWDFEGTVRIPQSWWETVWPFVGTGVPGAVALVAYGVTGSPVGLVAGGVVTGAVALVLDSRRSR